MDFFCSCVVARRRTKSFQREPGTASRVSDRFRHHLHTSIVKHLLTRQQEVFSPHGVVSPVRFPESAPVRPLGGGGELRLLLVVNCDLEPECMDSELRVALQWIAASELGLPALHFRRSKEISVAKVGGAKLDPLSDVHGFVCLYFFSKICPVFFTVVTFLTLVLR